MRGLDLSVRLHILRRLDNRQGDLAMAACNAAEAYYHCYAGLRMYHSIIDESCCAQEEAARMILQRAANRQSGLVAGAATQSAVHTYVIGNGIADAKEESETNSAELRRRL